MLGRSLFQTGWDTPAWVTEGQYIWLVTLRSPVEMTRTQICKVIVAAGRTCRVVGVHEPATDCWAKLEHLLVPRHDPRHPENQ